METVTGKIHKVVYEAQDSEFKILQLIQKDGSRVTVKGEIPEALIGSYIEVHGEYRSHPKWGTGLNISSCAYSHDNSSQSICLYLQSIAKWIGPQRAREIANKFGSQLEEILEKNPERLTEIEGIGKKVARSVADSWLLNKEMKNIRIFLHSLGLTDRRVKKIITRYGSETEEVLKRNPFLLSFEGFGFSTCDFVASKLGLSPEEPLRYRYFILYALKQCLNSGHLFLTPNEIVYFFNSYSQKAKIPFNRGEAVIFKTLHDHIDKLIADGFIYKERDNYYEINSFFYENESARIIKNIQDTHDTCKFDHIDPEDFINRYEKEHSFKFSPEQNDAVKSFFTEKVMIITGSPGTGKTTILRAFVQLLKESKSTFELLTPTGISAKKLGKTAGHDASTIHRKLGFKGEKWDYNAHQKFTTQVVIVDEISMVDMEVFYRLVSAMYPTTKFVFVGDNDQLPSVGPGNVLKELITSNCLKTVFLSQIFRQEKQSEIILEAKKIKEGDDDLTYFRSNKESDIWFLRMNNAGQIEDSIVKFAKQLKESERVKKDKKYFQIISPRNNGPLSVDTLNIALQNVLNPPDPNKKEIKLNHCVIRKGDRVIIRKNDYKLDVYNGDIGKVAFITPSVITIDLEDYNTSGERVEIPVIQADDMIKLAYAITVHKCQGLEYPLVIMPFVRSHGQNMLQRNLLYTALTRAKKKVVVLGQGSAIQKAIQNNRIQKRNTLLAERIKGWTKGYGTSLQELYLDFHSCQNAKNLKQLLSLEEKTSSASQEID